MLLLIQSILDFNISTDHLEVIKSFAPKKDMYGIVWKKKRITSYHKNIFLSNIGL